jgi:spore coat protein U-like protein
VSRSRSASALLQRALLALVASGGSGAALAAATCTISAVGPAFGNYDPLSGTATTANGSVLATCNWTGGGSTTVNMVASYGTGNSGSYPNRFMLSGANQLNYNIYFNATYTTIRGNGTAGTQTGSATLTVSSGNRTATASGVLYGRIPAGQDATPGNYTDTIVITLTY